MSVNTAPGGHTWAGGVALPLASGPEEWTATNENGGVGVFGIHKTWAISLFVICDVFLLIVV